MRITVDVPDDINSNDLLGDVAFAVMYAVREWKSNKEKKTLSHHDKNTGIVVTVYRK